ncbi:MAG: L-serine ammonia-lyase, iron-sulfur-dependent, subunit alpha, partial [Lachnospiraceae bacterium]
MNQLTRLIKEDMKPALGVTEPGAIAFAVSTARTHMKGAVKQVFLRLNSGMFKNAFTCGIPGISEVGNYHAAALGAVAADPKKGLECLDGISDEEKEAARKMVEQGQITVSMGEITSRIYIEAKVIGEASEASVIIRDAHTNIVKITENGKTIWEKDFEEKEQETEKPLIHRYTLEQIYEYTRTVPAEEISFIRAAFKMNEELMMEGINSSKTTYAPYLLAANGGKIVSDDEQKTASLFCNAAIEARVLGLSRPAMSITGSGAHGIIATMPLYAVCRVKGYTEDALLRAAALSYLICMYIKEYSGKLSAFCGCAIAAGTGMACGL